jgi:hypothetical protein
MLTLQNVSFDGPHFRGLALIPQLPGVVALVELTPGEPTVLDVVESTDIRETTMTSARKLRLDPNGRLRGYVTRVEWNPDRRAQLAESLRRPSMESPWRPKSWKPTRRLTPEEYRRKRRY